MIFFFLTHQTQEREANAEMRRKAKELQQARRDAERAGKKAPGFGGFGSSGMSSTATIITDSVMEPEKPKSVPVSVRCVYCIFIGKELEYVRAHFCHLRITYFCDRN